MAGRAVRGLVAMLAALVLVTTGCSSDKPPTKAVLVSKLQSDTEFATVKSKTTAAQYGTLIDCFADFLIKKGKASDLNDYVKGTRTFKDIRGFGTQAGAEQEGKNCAAKAGLG